MIFERQTGQLKPIVQRAFEAARSSNFKSVEEIKEASRREGYSQVEGHLSPL